MAQIDIPVGTWQIDPAHTGINFAVRHMMVAKVRGRFATFSGTITTTEDVQGSSVEAVIDVQSIDTNDATRDEHLRSADFFDAANHPNMTFRSTGVGRKGDDYTLTGDLTIRDVTKAVTLDLEFGGFGKDPWGNTKLGVTATGSISRKDFGLEWNAALEGGGVLVGDKINLELDVEALLQTEAATT